MPESKRCTGCSEIKSVSDFHVRLASRDGLNAACKACILARRRAQWDAKLAATGKERKYDRPVIDGRKECTLCRAWKAVGDFGSHSNQCRACLAALQLQRFYARHHPDGIQRALFGVTEDEERRGAVRRATTWNRAHPEVRRELTRQRRARLGGKRLPGLSRSAIAERMRYFGHRCWICGGPQEEVDHVKPVAKGGAHMLCNLRPICGPCNRRKSATWPFEVSQSRRAA